ncbi:Hypp2714 [Branchiostoma lanceolatum]|uniref:Hypp2714 protein n=1 Tax=Branchiostoma lanceolatum TaxID=7740 RepID=A0A8K0EP82_BRALA|nr:Hypp2714 [Branchiostoma lanceolatum]
MTTAHPERNWTQLQEGLNRVRKELGGNPHASLDPEDKPARVMSAGKHKHIYPSRRTPPQLPQLRLSTPPEYYSDDDLRRGRRKVVPPVKPKRDAFQRPVSDEDSYDSGESSDEDRAYPYHNGPAPPQPYPYGYYQPPMVYPPMPAFYPQPQPHHHRTKRRDRGKSKAKGRQRPQENGNTRVKHLGSRRAAETHRSHRDAATHTVEEWGIQADESDTVQDARALSKFKAKESLNYTPVVNDFVDKRTNYPKAGGGRMDPLEVSYLRPKQAVYDTGNLYTHRRPSPQLGTSLYPYDAALDTYKYIHPDQHKPSYSPVMRRPLADPSQAATAIQKTFRGYSTRKRLHYDRVLRNFVVSFINTFLEDQAIPDVLIGVLKTDPSKAAMSAAFHFQSDRRFAQNYVDSLIGEMMEEELVPDILIEVLSEHGNQTAQEPVIYSPRLPHGLTAAHEDLAAGVTEDFLNSQLKPHLRDVILESNRELVDRYFAEKSFDPRPIRDVSEEIMEEVVQEGTEEAIKGAVSDMVGDTIYRGASYDWTMDLATDVIGEFMPDIVREAVFDVILEQMIDTEIVSEVVEEEAHSTSSQVLEKYDNAVQRRELREVASRANKRLLDGVFLHHLLNLFARDGQVMSREDLALKSLDGIVLDNLLQQYFVVRNSRQFTLDNWPTKRLHEKVVTDTAVDVVLTELGQQLDEDMEDLHEYEFQLEDPDSFRAGGMDLKEWLGKLNVSPR